jgi:hypothetical protein
MTPVERLAELDERFVQIYEAARSRLLDEQKERALIVINDDHMLFFHGSGEPQVIGGLRPPIYDKLKSLNHAPLAIHCLLVDRAGGDDTISPSTLAALDDYRKQLAAAAGDLDVTNEYESGILARELDILGRARIFLDRIIREGRVSASDLASYGRANLADINASFFAATKAQLDACHEHIMHLRENVLSAEEWASLRVVVTGPHMAHKEQNFLQYFSKLLHTPMYADKRLAYFEGDDIEGALDLMGTAILDFRVSQAIFDDESRLHRDILADATKQYLHELLSG